MRHHLFTTLLCLLLPCLAAAQVGSYRADLAVGINGGYALNQISFNPTIKQSWKGGATLGLTIRYTCEKYLSAICALQGELNYIDLGWKELIEPAYGTDTYYRQVHYLQVPILARLGWGREVRGLQGYLVVGPQVGFCIGEKEHYSDPWAGTPRPNNITQQYGRKVENFFEYGITAGAGAELSIPHVGHFLIEGRYYYGLSDIFHNSKRDPFGRSANGAIIIKASYLFDLLRTKGIERK